VKWIFLSFLIGWPSLKDVSWVYVCYTVLSLFLSGHQCNLPVASLAGVSELGTLHTCQNWREPLPVCCVGMATLAVQARV
jgi:hypothetical protein